METQEEQKQAVGKTEHTGESEPVSDCCSTSCCGGTVSKKNSDKEDRNGNS